MKLLDRRTLLKGLLGGTVVSIALPPLEAMMNSTGTAYAQLGGFPKRFGVFFWGNGVLPATWVPADTSANWALSPILAPLAESKSKLMVVSGARVATLNTAPHEAGPAGLLTGDQRRNGSVTGPSLDQLIANANGGATRFRSLEVGVQPNTTDSLSFSGPNQMNPVESSPRALFNRLFTDGFRAPGDMSGPDPALALRASVLDAVRQQGTRLQTRLGAADRMRVEQHLDGIRALERQIQLLQQNPPNLAACRLPTAPPESIADLMGRPDMRVRARLVSDLLVMAMACDQTRTFFNMYTQPVNNTLFGDAPAGHHELTHNEAGAQPMVQAILVLIMQDLNYFLRALDAIQEGSGTLLDHTLVLCTSDCSYGRTHALDEYPIVLAGARSLGLRQNVHLRALGENASKLSLSILQMMDVHVTEFGVGSGMVNAPLSGLLT